MAVVVVGSINQDLVVRVDRHPKPGETVLGTGHFMAPGGKGANQAVALARLGWEVEMVGRVGDDSFGHALRHGLDHEGVNVRHVRVDLDAETGLAVITLDADAENSIVVSPGANGRVTPSDIELARDVVGDATVVLMQLEIPLDAVEAAAFTANGLVILNPAPARTLSAALLERVDVLIPNRSELGILAGVDEPGTQEEVIEAVSTLGHPKVVVTLGADGALVVAGGDSYSIAAPEVDTIDTVGAGDAFCGAVADALARGLAIDEAAEWGVVAGALATTKLGAQPSMPTRDAVAVLVGG